MGQYNFKSPGAAVSSALSEEMIRREMLARQARLDDLNSKNINSEMADRTANRAIQDRRVNLDEDKAKSDAAKEEAQALSATQTRNRANAEMIPQGTEMAPDQAKNLLGDLTPVLTKQQGGIVPPEQGEGPDMKNVFTGTTKQGQFDEIAALKERLAQVAADAKMAHDKTTNDLAEQRISHAQAVLQMQQQNADVLNRLREVQMAGAQGKQDAAAKTQADAANTAKMSRSELRALTEGIKNDPNLEHVLGPLNGSIIPSVRDTSVDLDARIKRLVSMLSLENRSKLKGQGAISDFETKMLAAAGSSLSQRTSSGIFKKELQRILDAQSGDAPRDVIPGYDPDGNQLAGGDVTAPPKKSPQDYWNQYSVKH